MMAQAMGNAGAWSRWTTERQLWFLRVKGGLTQAQLAARCGISQARISRIEAGADMKWSTLKRLLASFGYQPALMLEPLGTAREGVRYRRGDRKKMSPAR